MCLMRHALVVISLLLLGCPAAKHAAKDTAAPQDLCPDGTLTPSTCFNGFCPAGGDMPYFCVPPGICCHPLPVR